MLVLSALLCAAAPARAAAGCGKIVTVATHSGSTTRYSLGEAAQIPGKPPMVLVLLAGGSGFVELGDDGCPQALTGNSLLRMAPVFRRLGFLTALVDAPSDLQVGDGLAGFRSHPDHAADLARIIIDLRQKTGAPVWLAGTSRGTISAVNAGSLLKGAAAPDGIVLTSALMAGQEGRARKSWAKHSVFDHELGAVTVPTLLLGHADDKCLRSPPDRMQRLFDDLGGARKQMVTVTGGPGWRGDFSLRACAGRAPHGFVEQDEEVAAGIGRFVRGGKY